MPINKWKCVTFGFVGFYGISTNVAYLLPKRFYANILNIYDLVGLCWVLGHINHCRLFNAKSFLSEYIWYIWSGLVGFYGISTIVWVYGISTTVGYLMPNPLYIYILDISDLLIDYVDKFLMNLSFFFLAHSKKVPSIAMNYLQFNQTSVITQS